MGILWLSHSRDSGRRGSASAVQGLQYKKIFGHSLAVFISAAIFRPKMMCVNCFTLKARRGFFCQNQQWVSKPSRFPGTQRLTQSRDSPSGSSKLGTSLSAFISGVWEPVVGRGGAGCVSVEEWRKG